MYHNNLAYQPLDWPADLYRSNYWGFGNHVDEPGVHNWGLPPQEHSDAPLPEVQVVKNLQRIVRQGVEKRGCTAINGSFTKNFGLGALEIEEGPDSIFAWEYEWPTAWYQLAVDNGVGGIVDEDVTLNDLVETYNMGLGTQIPPSVDHAVAIRVAVLRGAARNFHKKWGVAFYHPNEVKLKSASIPLLYEKGASCFWYRTGWIGITDNSGLPYPYQLYYTSLIREAFDRNPDRDMDALLHAAKVAVDDPLFHKTGYDQLIYAQADGTVRRGLQDDLRAGRITGPAAHMAVPEAINSDGTTIRRSKRAALVFVRGLGFRGGRAAFAAAQHFEIARLGAQKKLHLAVRIPLPATTAQTENGFDFVPHLQLVGLIATFMSEFQRNVIDEFSLVLLQNNQPLSEPLLPEALRFLDQMHGTLYYPVAHQSVLSTKKRFDLPPVQGDSC